jgi:hypothetical protein
MPVLNAELSEDQRGRIALVPDPARAVASAVSMLSPGDKLVICWPYASKTPELEKLIIQAQGAFFNRPAALADSLRR